MTKLTWEKYVEVHGQGFGISVGSDQSRFKVPRGLAPSGKNWPAISKLISDTLKPGMKGDWATTTTYEVIKPTGTGRNKTKARRIYIVLLVFQDLEDRKKAGKVLGAVKHDMKPGQKKPFRTLDGGRGFHAEQYERFARHLGYLPPKSK